jgi:dTMP kinase
MIHQIDKKGLFITFEGGEGVGKSTQISKLREALENLGYDVIQTREPGGCPEAEQIRDLILKSEQYHFDPLSETLLLYAARYEHVKKKIQPALDVGKIVLCDRFADSTLVYQGYAGGLSLSLLETLYTLIIGDLKPDLTFVLDLPVALSSERTQSRGLPQDRFESKEQNFHVSLRQGFLDLAKRYPERMIVIDAFGAVEEVFQRIVIALKERQGIDLTILNRVNV